MFKFGVDSFIWSESFSAEDIGLVARAKELGFEVFDTFISDPKTYPVEAVKRAAHDLDMPIVTTAVLDDDTNIISPDPDVRARGLQMLKELIDINVAIGSPVLGGVTYASWGYLTRRPRTAQEWDWSVTAMCEAARYAREQSDLVIAVEVLNRFETHFLNIAEDAVQYCKDVGVPNMRVHLDTFHMIREETSFEGAVRTCGDYLGYVHTCESNRGIPGTGLVPWREFFSALLDIGYDGYACIESFDPSFEELSSNCAIWRNFAESGEELAVKGQQNLRAIMDAL